VYPRFGKIRNRWWGRVDCRGKLSSGLVRPMPVVMDDVLAQGGEEMSFAVNEIPHVTLLDLDSGRHQGGWGRVRNTLRQVNAVSVKPPFRNESINALPKWNDDHAFPLLNDLNYEPGRGPLRALERKGVFFSEPVDLDLMMLEAYPDAYEVDRVKPDESAIVAVLGKKHINESRLGVDLLELFDDYHTKFDLKSKPAAHLAALSTLTDGELLDGLPRRTPCSPVSSWKRSR
jgi:putative ATP-dependent endonuclease of OLD family